MIALVMAAVLAADQPQVGNAPGWLLLVAGVGVGTGLAGFATAAVTWRTSSRQREHDRAERQRDREHDLALRRQQFDHELRLERLRDRQKLRDTRVERLRDDFTLVLDLAYELWPAVDLIAADNPVSASAVTDAVIEKFNPIRSRLRLDNAGVEIGVRMVKIFELTRAGIRHKREDSAPHILEKDRALLEASINGLRDRILQLLEDAEREPFQEGSNG